MDKEDSKTNLLSVIFWTVGILFIALFLYSRIILPFPEYASEQNVWSWSKLDLKKTIIDAGLQEKNMINPLIPEQTVYSVINITTSFGDKFENMNETYITIKYKSDNSPLRLRVIDPMDYGVRPIIPAILKVDKKYNDEINETFILNPRVREIVIVEDTNVIYKFYIQTNMARVHDEI